MSGRAKIEPFIRKKFHLAIGPMLIKVAEGVLFLALDCLSFVTGMY